MGGQGPGSSGARWNISTVDEEGAEVHGEEPDHGNDVSDFGLSEKDLDKQTLCYETVAEQLVADQNEPKARLRELFDEKLIYFMEVKYKIGDFIIRRKR